MRECVNRSSMSSRYNVGLGGLDVCVCVSVEQFSTLSDCCLFRYGYEIYAFWHALLQVYYNFNPIFMLAEPLMLASVFFFLFVACVAYLHIDLSIRKWKK